MWSLNDLVVRRGEGRQTEFAHTARQAAQLIFGDVEAPQRSDCDQLIGKPLEHIALQVQRPEAPAQEQQFRWQLANLIVRRVQLHEPRKIQAWMLLAQTRWLHIAPSLPTDVESGLGYGLGEGSGRTDVPPFRHLGLRRLGLCFRCLLVGRCRCIDGI